MLSLIGNWALHLENSCSVREKLYVWEQKDLLPMRPQNKFMSSITYHITYSITYHITYHITYSITRRPLPITQGPLPKTGGPITQIWGTLSDIAPNLIRIRMRNNIPTFTLELDLGAANGLAPKLCCKINSNLRMQKELERKQQYEFKVWSVKNPRHLPLHLLKPC